MWAQEEKVQILEAIHASLPVVAEKATLLQAAGVPNLDATIITGEAPNSSEGPGTSTSGVAPQGLRTFVGALAPPPHQITSDFVDPLNLPANCLMARDLDQASEVEAGSNSRSSSEKELNEVHPPPSDFQDVNHNSSIRVAYRDLVPMTRLFSTWLPISEGNQMHLPDFIQGCDILLDLCHDHENFKRQKGVPPLRTIIAWWKAAGGVSPTKNLPQSHPCSPFPDGASLPLGLAWWLLPTSWLFPEPGSIQKAAQHCQWHWSVNLLQMWGFGGQVVLIWVCLAIRIGFGCLTCKTLCSFYLIRPTHLLIHHFDLQTLLIML